MTSPDLTQGDVKLLYANVASNFGLSFDDIDEIATWHRAVLIFRFFLLLRHEYCYECFWEC